MMNHTANPMPDRMEMGKKIRIRTDKGASSEFNLLAVRVAGAGLTEAGYNCNWDYSLGKVASEAAMASLGYS